MANAKWVRFSAPAGVTCNYMCVTGNHNATVISFELIKKLLDRGCLVEELKTDGTYITLTDKNYNVAQTGAKAVDASAQFASNIEAEHDSKIQKKFDDRLEAIKNEIFKKK